MVAQMGAGVLASVGGKAALMCSCFDEPSTAWEVMKVCLDCESDYDDDEFEDADEEDE